VNAIFEDCYLEFGGCLKPSRHPLLHGGRASLRTKTAFATQSSAAHKLAQSAQRLVIGGNPRECSWLTLPLEKRPSVCEFDVIYTGSALMASQSGGETQRGGGVQGCLVSDGCCYSCIDTIIPQSFAVPSGAFIFLLTQFGLLKMGTGLSETRAGEVLHCNEILKFSEGSALFVSNESLYLRRRHSSRLWVLDTDNLREIGEIMFAYFPILIPQSTHLLGCPLH
jgi:hypothetical protein